MFKEIGHWPYWPDIPMVEIDGEVYALNGWNGEKYLHCWRCTGQCYMYPSEEEYEIMPICEEISEDEWEVVDYDVRRA
jgi:hypothetical protein